MVSSTVAISALFLMIELLERDQGPFAAMLSVTAEAYGFGEEEAEDGEPEIGLALPGTMTALGLCFGACTLLLAGLPPLAGFLGKFALVSAALNPAVWAKAGRFPAWPSDSRCCWSSRGLLR